MEYWRWKFAREFGWTLEQIDALTIADIHEYFQTTDGMKKAAQSIYKKASG